MIKNTKKILLARHSRRFLFVAVIFCMAIVSTFSDGIVYGVSADLSKSYHSDQQLNGGEIVRLDESREGYVTISNSSDKYPVFGVVTTSGESTIAINSDDKSYQVAVSGRVEVNISLENGSIQRGDLIGVSNTQEGYGSKVIEPNGQKIIGIAESSYGSQDQNDNHKLSILLNPGTAPSENKQMPFIRTIAGKNVSAMRLLVVAFVALLGLVSIAILIISSIKTGITAVGRNPLAKPAIFGAIAQTMIMVVVVACVSLGLMYLLLRV